MFESEHDVLVLQRRRAGRVWERSRAGREDCRRRNAADHERGEQAGLEEDQGWWCHVREEARGVWQRRAACNIFLQGVCQYKDAVSK